MTIEFGAIADKMPPHNIEAEEAILGGILLDPEAMGRIVDTLDAEAFYISAHKDIYQACLRLHSQNKSINLLTVTAWLSDHDSLKQVGGKSKLAQLVDRTVSAVNIDALAELVQDKYLSRKLVSAGNEITKMGYEQSEPILERMDAAEAKLFAIRHKTQSNSELKTAADICLSVFKKIEQIANTGSLPSIPTGFYDLDALLGGGLYPGDLIVVAGRPSTGKSLFAHSLAFKIAKIHESPTLIFSLEMSNEQVVTRFLSSASGIETTRLRVGELQSEEWAAFAEAVESVSEAKVLIDDSSCPSPYEIRSKVRQAIAKHGQLKLVVIDYLQLMADGSDARLVQKLGEITRQLKLLARECNVPIVIVSQLNREVESRNNKRPYLSDLRDSGRIEEDADVVLGIYRDAYYNPDTPDRDIAEIICLKQRNGATGTVKLLFNGALSQFLNLAS